MNFSNFDYYDNPYFDILRIYETLGPLGFFVNIFGIFVISTQTPSRMREYATTLLFHLVVGTIFEFSWAILVCPRLYAPMFMGSTDGLITRWFEIDVFYQEATNMIMVHILSCTVTHLILFRANSVLPPGFHWRLRPRQFAFVILAYYFLNVTPNLITHLFVKLNQNGMRNGKAFVETHPEFPSLLPYKEKMYLIDADKWGRAEFYTMAISGSWGSFIGVLGFIVILSSIFSHTNRSKQSKLNVKRILFTLSVQISPTLICYSASMGWIVACTGMEITFTYNQVLNDVACLLIGLHNSLSVVAALLLNNVYREYLMTPFKTAANAATRNSILRVSTTVVQPSTREIDRMRRRSTLAIHALQILPRNSF